MSNRRDATQDLFQIHGMNRLLHPLSAKFEEPLSLINYDSSTRLAKTLRTGYSKFLDAPDTNEIYDVKGFTKADGTTSFVLRFSGKYVYKYVPGVGSTWGAPIFTFGTDPTGVTVKMFQNRVFISSINGANDLISYDGTTFFTESSTSTGPAPDPPKKPHYLEEYANRLRCANDATNASTIKSSSVLYGATQITGAPTVPFDGHQWDFTAIDPSTARSFQLSPDAGGVCLMCKKVHDKLVVWKGSNIGEQSMHRLVDSGTGYLNPQTIPGRVSIRPGGERTIHLNEFGDCFFANDKGIYLYNGDRPKRQSLILGTLYQDIGFTPKAGIDHNMRYLVAASAPVTIDANTPRKKTLTNPILIQDYQSNEFLFYDTAHRMTCFSAFASTSTGPVQMYSGSASGQCYIWDGSTTDDGIAINGLIETRFYYGASIYNDMLFEQIHTYAEGAGQNIAFRPYGQDVFSGAQDVPDGLGSLPMSGDLTHIKALAYQVTTSSKGTPPKWYGLSLWYKEESSGAD